MKFARLILLGAFASAVGFSAAGAATLAPKLHSHGGVTLADADAGTAKPKKAKKPKVAHKVHKAKKVKKDT